MISNKELPVEQISRDCGKACSGGPMWVACDASAVAAGDNDDGGAGGSISDDDDDVS